MRIVWGLCASLGVVITAGSARAAPCDTSGADLIVDGITCQLSGIHTFDTVSVQDGGVIEVSYYNWGSKVDFGNLELRVRTYGDLYLVAFSDVGDVQPGEVAYQPDEWNYSAGSGLRYDSAIGKFRLEVIGQARRPAPASSQRRKSS